MRSLLFIFFVLVISACVKNNIVQNDSMGAVLKYTGFAIKKPTDKRWYIDTNEQNQNFVIFRVKSQSPTHTLFASIGRYSIPQAPETIKDFSRIVKKQKIRSLNSRFKLISYTSEASKIQGLWGVKYRIRTIDSKPLNQSKPLIITQYGFIVLHPNWKNTVINAEYSERGLASEIDKEYSEIGKQLLKGVIIQSAPGKAFSG